MRSTMFSTAPSRCMKYRNLLVSQGWQPSLTRAHELDLKSLRDPHGFVLAAENLTILREPVRLDSRNIAANIEHLPLSGHRELVVDRKHHDNTNASNGRQSLHNTGTRPLQGLHGEHPTMKYSLGWTDIGALLRQL
jgi:hypothetical protein